MLASLPLSASAESSVTHSPLIPCDLWDKKSRVTLRWAASGSASPKGKMGSKDEEPLRKREVRLETRKVSALSLKQLERKRANDREAQRSVRQRTKEHIELLENQVTDLQMQVAALRPRSERCGFLVKRNASLEEEVNRLRHQLSACTGYPVLPSEGDQAGFYQIGCVIEGPNSAPLNNPTTTSIPSTNFPESSHSSPSVPRAASAMSAISPSSYPHDWQHPYCSARSPSLGNSVDTEYSTQVDPYFVDGQIHQFSPMVPSSVSTATPQPSFSNITSPTQSLRDFYFPHIYSVDQYQGQLPDDPLNELFPSQKSISITMPGVTAGQSTSASYPFSYPSLILPSVDPF